MPRILVIDDEELLRSTVVTMLTRAGFTVEDTSDGKAGLAMVHKNPPDLVITDIFMPDSDGIEIIKALKHSCTQTKIIAMTGGGDIQMMEVASMAKLLGAAHILHKPFDRKSLLEAVDAVLTTPLPPKSPRDA